MKTRKVKKNSCEIRKATLKLNECTQDVMDFLELYHSKSDVSRDEETAFQVLSKKYQLNPFDSDRRVLILRMKKVLADYHIEKIKLSRGLK
jgi:hypothetical protein